MVRCSIRDLTVILCLCAPGGNKRNIYIFLLFLPLETIVAVNRQEKWIFIATQVIFLCLKHLMFDRAPKVPVFRKKSVHFALNSHWSPWGQSSLEQYPALLWVQSSWEQTHREDPSGPGDDMKPWICLCELQYTLFLTTWRQIPISSLNSHQLTLFYQHLVFLNESLLTERFDLSCQENWTRFLKCLNVQCGLPSNGKFVWKKAFVF